MESSVHELELLRPCRLDPDSVHTIVRVHHQTACVQATSGRNDSDTPQTSKELEMSTVASDTSPFPVNQHGSIRVYNTLTRQKEAFQTVTPGRVGMYLCGPTVYKPSHIGHMVGPVIFDCIKRYLTYCGYEVTWVVNITDVDDKLIAEANRRNLSMAEIAEEMTLDYVENLAALGVTQIDVMPKATEHMQQIIDFIQQLVDKGFAYASEGDVYFEVNKDKDYGKLSNRTVEDQQGEGGEMGARKRSPGDFALWKGARPGEPSWESPWGAGRPGWHIECSAMSHAILGDSFDIHGGGLDLMFPHHENEIAQSESCHDQPMARYWMHNGLMRASSAKGKVGGRNDRDDAAAEPANVDTKISRSKGAGGLAELIAEQTGERIRFFILRSHYRSTSVYGEDQLAEAGTALAAFHRFFERFERIAEASFHALTAPTLRSNADSDLSDTETPAIQITAQSHRQRFLEKMDDDFNSGAAISELFELVRALNKFADQENLDDPNTRHPAQFDAFVSATITLRELASILGLFESAPVTATSGDDGLIDQVLQILIRIRQSARQQKDFELSDLVRDRLACQNITLEDRNDGTGWRLDDQANANELLDQSLQILIEIRKSARENKNFELGDQIREQLAGLNITLEDRAGTTQWRRES